MPMAASGSLMLVGLLGNAVNHVAARGCSTLLWRQDRGQSACAAAFLQAVRAGGPSPIAMEELVEVGKVVLGLGDGLG
jgi:hypothetical protein